jgi:putative endonuclease
MYYTYILYSPEFNKIYIGHTDDVQKRLERHKMGLVKSTNAYIPWELLYFETSKSRAQSYKRNKNMVNFLIALDNIILPVNS